MSLPTTKPIWVSGRAAAFLVIASSLVTVMAAQDIDSITTGDDRANTSIAGQIHDPGERAAFTALYSSEKPEVILSRSQAFLLNYPKSAFLAPAYEIAARSSFDLGHFKPGLEFAKKSLKLLPEDPLFQIAVADVQAREGQNDEAISSAQNALEDLDRFARPAALEKSAWPDLKRRRQGAAWFAIGRALTQKAFAGPVGPPRNVLFEQSAAALSQSIAFVHDDAESAYLLGIDHVMLRDWPRAAATFAPLIGGNSAFSQEARKQMQLVYDSQQPRPSGSFDSFVKQALTRHEVTSAQTQTQPDPPPSGELPGYAGSSACKGCHLKIYDQWAQSGMSKMLRPYAAQNVAGDFSKNNEFYAGDRVEFDDGKVVITRPPNRALFARMIVRDGKHYFDVKQSDGRWHSYPVSYTIGSKWQQAYATTLPNGQIHVFPVQYNMIEKQWVNYWESIDTTGSERANPYTWEKHGMSTSYRANCAICHTSQVRNTKGRSYKADNIVFREPGIGCEMCHGPSATHISMMEDGEDYYKRPVDPPVEFDKIGNRVFLKICAQCHMQSSQHTASPTGELNYSRQGDFFLTSLLVPYGEFSRKAFFKDGRFSQSTFIVEALERSQCFRKGQATCGSCHDPHGHDMSHNLTSLKFSEPNQMCVGCHSRFKQEAAAAAHSHHMAGTDASQCVSCHMPRIMNALLFRARSHQIDDIPDGEMTARFGQAESPNACLICHTDKPPQWVDGTVKSWGGKRGP